MYKGYKLKYTCESKIDARCVYYEGSLSEHSALKVDDVCNCVTVEEAVSDLYKLVDSLKSSVDVSSLGGSCVNYGKVSSQLSVKDVLVKFEQLFCSNNGSGSNGGVSLDIKKLDLKCLESPCNDGIRTLRDLLQAIINKLCSNG